MTAPTPHPDLDALRADLEIVVMDTVAGSPLSDKLLKSIRRVVEARLRRLVGAWIRGYEVTATADQTGTGVQVTVLLRTAQQVERLEVTTRGIG